VGQRAGGVKRQSTLAGAPRKVSENVYAVKVGDFQRVRIPPGQSVARPEATRAIEEVTNLLKYSGVTGHLR
jgi:hypothetical protein